MPEAPFISSLGRARNSLRRFADRAASVERCEVCAARLPAEHEHLFDPARRRVSCVCTACAVSEANLAGTLRVPKRVLHLEDFQLTDAQWSDLLIPINVAFFFRSSVPGDTQPERVVAMYPSPAGATESLLELGAWEEIVLANPVLRELQPDVEALLVNRLTRRDGQPGQYFIAPIDECYRLVGLLRKHWRGLSGGTRAWRELEQFFEDLARRTSV